MDCVISSVSMVGVNESTHFYAGAFIFMFMYEKCLSQCASLFNEMKNLNESGNRTLHSKRANGLI